MTTITKRFCQTLPLILALFPQYISFRVNAMRRQQSGRETGGVKHTYHSIDDFHNYTPNSTYTTLSGFNHVRRSKIEVLRGTGIVQCLVY